MQSFQLPVGSTTNQRTGLPPSDGLSRHNLISILGLRWEASSWSSSHSSLGHFRNDAVSGNSRTLAAVIRLNMRLKEFRS